MLVTAGCTRKPGPASTLKPTAFGAALVESSGGKQIGATGMVLAQPLVVQVNDEQGTAVTGALLEFTGPAGVSFDPSIGLTDSSGQLSANVALGVMAGRYQLTAHTSTKAQKSVELKIEEIALGYQEQVAFQLDNKYCARCHNPESTPDYGSARNICCRAGMPPAPDIPARFLRSSIRLISALSSTCAR